MGGTFGQTFEKHGDDFISILSGLGRLDESFRDREAHSRDAENTALATMMDAEDKARQERKASRKEADKLRKERRRERSRALIALGKSGVTLSGSPLAVLAGRTAEDERDYLTVLDVGGQRAESILSRGRTRAALTRGRDKGSGSDWLSEAGFGLAETIIKNGPAMWRTTTGGRR